MINGADAPGRETAPGETADERPPIRSVGNKKAGSEEPAEVVSKRVTLRTGI